jgi:predicted DNA-binding transcriptional regulator YafY
MRLEFDYVNYKGEASHRQVHFERVRFGASPWHQEPQWLLQAFDLDKNESREFALKDMTNVKEII